MTTYYADSSVLVRRHALEIGTSWFEAITQPTANNRIVTSRISTIEVLSAFQLKQREGLLSAVHVNHLTTDFLALCSRDYSLVDVTVDVLDHARNLIQRYPLKAYDAVQLASAGAVSTLLHTAGFEPLVFLSADRQLLRAAGATGLIVDSPDLHP